MQLNQIMLQAERVPQVIATVLFGAVTGLFLDAAAFGNIKIDLNPTLMWAVVALAGFSTLWCLKNTVFPSVIFVANSSGIKIGRGIFINRLRHIPWERLTSIDEGTIKILEKRQERLITQEVPAVKLVFDESIDLGKTGYKMAHPSERRNYLIAGGILRQTLPETIATLKDMKERYTKQ